MPLKDLDHDMGIEPICLKCAKLAFHAVDLSALELV